MAPVNLTVNRITRNGVAPATPTPGTSAGFMFDNNGDTFVEITNAAGATRTVTFVTPGTVGDRTIQDLDVALPASTTWRVGPFPPGLYNRASSDTDPGKVYVLLPAGQEAQVSMAAYTLQ